MIDILQHKEDIILTLSLFANIVLHGAKFGGELLKSFISYMKEQGGYNTILATIKGPKQQAQVAEQKQENKI